MNKFNFLLKQFYQSYAVCIAICVMLILPIISHAATIVVTSSADSGPGTLREAITTTAVSGDIITFSTAINGQLIQLVPAGIGQSQIIINKSLTIIGNGIDNTIIDGALDTRNRLFDLFPGIDVRFEGMTFQNGGGSTSPDIGAAISNGANLSILDCKFSNNSTGNLGQVVFQSTGHLEVVNCEFSNNGTNATNDEPLLYSQSSGSSMSISQSLFFSNLCSEVFEGVNDGGLDFRLNTLSGNTVSEYVLKFSSSIIEIHNNILDDNVDPIFQNGGALSATNNISRMADPALTSANNNLVGNALLNADFTPMLSSPAIGAGSNVEIPMDVLDVDDDNNVTELLPLDYAGGTRQLGCTSSVVDMGAFELQEGSGVVTNVNDAGVGSLRYVVDLACSGDIITFDPAINTQLIQLTSGQITIDKDLTILGNGMANTIIDGSQNNTDRIFEVNASNAIDVHFEGLTIQNGGGANIFVGGVAIKSSEDISLLDCKFFQNNSNVGIIEITLGSLKAVNCIFQDNSLSSQGTAETLININNNSTGEIHQCVFSNNDITNTEIQVFNNTDLTFINNTILNDNPDGNFLGLFSQANNPGVFIVSNNIFDHTGDILVIDNNSTVTTSHNLSEHSDPELPEAAAGGTNIVGDAMLNPDLSLMPCSPAISAGDNASIPMDILDVDNDMNVTETLPTDYLANLRIFDTTVDIGAYENNSSMCGNAPCTENTVTIDTPEDPMGLYHAIIDIQSNTTVNNDAIYKAGSFIDLNEGFEVITGKLFEATIEPCN